jgi:hypothetical protein
MALAPDSLIKEWFLLLIFQNIIVINVDNSRPAIGTVNIEKENEFKFPPELTRQINSSTQNIPIALGSHSKPSKWQIVAVRRI